MFIYFHTILSIVAHSPDMAWSAIAAVVATIYDGHSELTSADPEMSGTPKSGENGRAVLTASTSEED